MCTYVTVCVWRVSVHMCVCMQYMYVCIGVCVCGSKQGKGEEIESPPENLRSKVVVTKMSCILTVGDSPLLNGLKAKNVFVSKGERNVDPKEEYGGEDPKGK